MPSITEQEAFDVRHALLVGSDSCLEGPWTMEFMASRTEVKKNGELIAYSQLNPSGGTRYMARADSLNCLPCFKDHVQDWVYSGNMLIGNISGMQTIVSPSQFIGFAAGEPNLNPLTQGGVIELNKSTKSKPPPPQEPIPGNQPAKGKPDDSQKKPEAAKPQPVEAKPQAAKPKPAEAKPEAQPAEGKQEQVPVKQATQGASPQGASTQPQQSPQDEDKEQGESGAQESEGGGQGQGNGQGGGQPPGLRIGDPVVHEKHGPLTILRVNKDGMKLQSRVTGKLVTVPIMEVIQGAIKYDDKIPKFKGTQSDGEHEVDTRNCVAGYRFLAIGEPVQEGTLSTFGYGDVNSIKQGPRSWGLIGKIDAKVGPCGKGQRFLCPFSHYIVKLDPQQKPKPKTSDMNREGWVLSYRFVDKEERKMVTA